VALTEWIAVLAGETKHGINAPTSF